MQQNKRQDLGFKVLLKHTSISELLPQFPLEATPVSRNVSIPTHQLLEDSQSTEKKQVIPLKFLIYGICTNIIAFFLKIKRSELK